MMAHCSWHYDPLPIPLTKKAKQNKKKNVVSLGPVGPRLTELSGPAHEVVHIIDCFEGFDSTI